MFCWDLAKSDPEQYRKDRRAHCTDEVISRLGNEVESVGMGRSRNPCTDEVTSGMTKSSEALNLVEGGVAMGKSR